MEKLKKVNNLKATDVISKIIFNITIGNKVYKDVEMNIENGDDWSLTFEDAHCEDNGSWTLVEVGSYVLDVQIFGNDDSQGLKSDLSMQGCIMEYDEKNKWYSHTNHWIERANFSKVRLVTNDGRIKGARINNKEH